MKNNSLHQFRTPPALLKYTLVLSLMLSVGLSIFADWHNPSHVLQTDQHCALCISSLNFEHSLPVHIPYFDFARKAIFTAGREPIHFHAVFVKTAGNRDPPIVS